MCFSEISLSKLKNTLQPPSPAMISIQEGTEKDFPVIQQIAYQTWPITFGNILSRDQIDYMLEMMYSSAALNEQLNQKRHQFLLAREAEHDAGFASYQIDYQGEPVTKIHKLYVVPTTQGKGVGRFLLNKIDEIARRCGNHALSLNVNRNNPAVEFYQHIGFRIVGEENISIGNGFLMEDYIMKRPVTSTLSTITQ